MPKGVYQRPTIADRFWPKVEKNGDDDCWPWNAALFQHGLAYGQFQWNGRPHLAHRIAWMLTNGPIEEGARILHHCDNPPCCNPRHLFQGTNTDNMRDMAKKARHHWTKMTRDRVEEVRRRAAAGENQRKLAYDYQRSEAWVSKVVHHKLWD